MNKYKVKISHVFTEVLNLDAESELDARKKAIEFLQQEEREIKTTYEATIPAEHWLVMTEGEWDTKVKELEAEIEKYKDLNNVITP